MQRFATRWSRQNLRADEVISSPRQRETSSSGMTSIFSGAWPRSCRSSSSKIPPRRGPAQHDRAVHRRIPDPSVGSIPLRLAGRPRRPQIYLPHDARRHGSGHRGDRVDPDLRTDRLGRRDHPLQLTNAPGLCLGGSYGGAITYVAEHVSDERRGYYTGWLQTSPTLGIVLSLLIIIATRTYFGEAAFNAWAWRIPFLCSFLLVFVTLWMRANFAGVAGLRGDQGQGANERKIHWRRLSSIPPISSTW